MRIILNVSCINLYHQPQFFGADVRLSRDLLANALVAFTAFRDNAFADARFQQVCFNNDIKLWRVITQSIT